MNIEQYAKESKLPLKILRWMVRENMVQNPLSDTDLIGLSLVEKLWGKKNFLRVQLTQFSYKRRLHLIQTSDLESKWERYAFSRFKNLPPKKKIKMQTIINEIELTYGFEIKPWHKSKLYKIRQKVYDLRRKEKMSGIPANKEKETLFLCSVKL